MQHNWLISGKTYENCSVCSEYTHMNSLYTQSLKTFTNATQCIEIHERWWISQNFMQAHIFHETLQSHKSHGVEITNLVGPYLLHING